MESPSYVSQWPAASAMGRRAMAVTSKETTGVQTSKCEVCKRGLFYSPPPSPPLCLSPACAAAQTQTHCLSPACAAAQTQTHCLSPACAAAQTQTQSTKPKANMLVACRRLSDGSEADQSPLLPLTLKGTMCLESTDPRATFSVHASITGKASVSDVQYGARRLYRKSNIPSEGRKRQYYRDLRLQVEERKQQMERERSRDVVDEQTHNDTMHTVWGMPGSGAPNYHLGTARRSGSLGAAGILPQEQTLLSPPVKRRPQHPQPETGSWATGAV